MASVEEIQRYALSLVGAPYVLGCEPWYDVGYEPSAISTASDCSGLVYAVMRKSGVPWKDGDPWPRLTANGYAQHCVRIPRSEVRCGDVALFAGKSGHVHHIALCIDHDWTVEARGRAWGVVTYKIDDPINGVVRRGAYFGRFPWVKLDEYEEGEADMTKEQETLLKLLRVSMVAHSNDARAILAQLRGNPAEADRLLSEAARAAEAEKRRLGLS